MKEYIKSSLLSALVFPGTGQFYNKQYVKGMIIIFLFISFITIIVIQILKLVDFIEITSINDYFLLINSIKDKLKNYSNPLLSISSISILILYLASIIDAFIISLNKNKIN